MPKLKLKAWRVNNDLTQEELASRLGVTVQTVCNWEKGYKKPRFENIKELANLFSCSTDDIIF